MGRAKWHSLRCRNVDSCGQRHWHCGRGMDKANFHLGIRCVLPITFCCISRRRENSISSNGQMCTRVHSDRLEVLTSSLPVVVRFAEYASSCTLAVENFLFASMRSRVDKLRFVKISFVRSRKTAWSAWIAPGQV
jgi:hypothetical protein